jgi:hypothetical protein
MRLTETQRKELATSTKSIIKKNELFVTMKNELDSALDKSKVNPLINIMYKNLKQIMIGRSFKKYSTMPIKIF